MVIPLAIAKIRVALYPAPDESRTWSRNYNRIAQAVSITAFVS
jgi:hypothetical protein